MQTDLFGTATGECPKTKLTDEMRKRGLGFVRITPPAPEKPYNWDKRVAWMHKHGFIGPMVQTWPQVSDEAARAALDAIMDANIHAAAIKAGPPIP